MIFYISKLSYYIKFCISKMCFNLCRLLFVLFVFSFHLLISFITYERQLLGIMSILYLSFYFSLIRLVNFFLDYRKHTCIKQNAIQHFVQ